MIEKHELGTRNWTKLAIRHPPPPHSLSHHHRVRKRRRGLGKRKRKKYQYRNEEGIWNKMIQTSSIIPLGRFSPSHLTERDSAVTRHHYATICIIIISKRLILFIVEMTFTEN